MTDLPVTAPTVLFSCVKNAGRSQIAAAYLRSLAGDRVRVLSAGSEPGDAVHPLVIEVMAEEGIDVAGARPAPLTVAAVLEADVVVTMGCGESCPIYPGRRYEDWPVTDPAELGLDGVRAVRDDIRARVDALMAELDIAR